MLQKCRGYWPGLGWVFDEPEQTMNGMSEKEQRDIFQWWNYEVPNEEKKKIKDVSELLRKYQAARLANIIEPVLREYAAIPKEVVDEYHAKHNAMVDKMIASFDAWNAEPEPDVVINCQKDLVENANRQIP